MSDLSKYFCRKPFDNFEVDTTGDVRICCGMWVSETIGNIYTTSPEEIFDSNMANKIRESILDGSFSFCNKELCPHISTLDLPKFDEVKDGRYKTDKASFPIFFNLMTDESCNLICPSCRISKVNFKSGPIYDKKKAGNDAIIKYTLKKARENPDHNIYLHITGSGDPFASRIYREFLFGFDGRLYPNVKINLQTNGMMFTEVYWDRLNKCHDNLSSVQVSFDAGTPETYAITRRDGDWNLLLKNYKMLTQKREEGKLDALRADFVVQDYNYLEMPDFVDIVAPLSGTDNIVFQKIVNWGTYSDEEFSKREICNPKHPEYEDFLKVLRDDRLRNPKICWGNVAPYYNEAHIK